jgi:glutathione S-transferase
MLTFYYSPGSCATASHIALEESGATYDARRVTLRDPSDPEDYRKVNPRGTVPALVVDGVLLTENVAILGYVARAFPQARLLPDDPLDQAACMSLAGWFSSSVHISYRRAFRPNMFTSDEAAQASVSREGREAFRENVIKLDELYRDRTWAIGDRFSVADCYALIFYGWGLNIDMPMSEFAAYAAFKERMTARPAVRRILEREDSLILQAI